jgi:hypothetical protein
MQNGEQKAWDGTGSWWLSSEGQSRLKADAVGRRAGAAPISKEPDWIHHLGLWARHTAFNASQSIGKRFVAWMILAGYAAFVFGFPALIWCTWHEWDFCRVAHFFSIVMPVYWIYLAVKARQRHEDGDPLLQPSAEETISAFEGWREWRTRMYQRPAGQKIADIVIRAMILGVLALIFRVRIADNGYFWFLCAELACRLIWMFKRPAGFAGPAAVEPV